LRKCMGHSWLTLSLLLKLVSCKIIIWSKF